MILHVLYVICKWIMFLLVFLKAVIWVAEIPKLWREWKQEKKKGNVKIIDFTLVRKEKILLATWIGTVAGMLIPGWLGYPTITIVVAVAGSITILGTLCWPERRTKC